MLKGKTGSTSISMHVLMSRFQAVQRHRPNSPANRTPQWLAPVRDVSKRKSSTQDLYTGGIKQISRTILPSDA